MLKLDWKKLPISIGVLFGENFEIKRALPRRSIISCDTCKNNSMSCELFSHSFVLRISMQHLTQEGA